MQKNERIKRRINIKNNLIILISGQLGINCLIFKRVIGHAIFIKAPIMSSIKKKSMVKSQQFKTLMSFYLKIFLVTISKLHLVKSPRVRILQCLISLRLIDFHKKETKTSIQ